jgi:hypothetical protein
MAYDPEARVGVIVLTNQVGDVGDIARHLLRPDFPLAKPANTKHIEIALDSKVLDSYVGREICDPRILPLNSAFLLSYRLWLDLTIKLSQSGS